MSERTVKVEWSDGRSVTVTYSDGVDEALAMQALELCRVELLPNIETPWIALANDPPVTR